jgi:hypothetical protein
MTLPLCALAFLLQNPAPAHPKVDQARVDAAIEKGCAWLLKQTGELLREFPHGKRNQPEATTAYTELILLTLAHSGFYPEEHAEVRKLVEHAVKKEIASTYTASLMAMALSKIDPLKYQWRIAQCAQFLVDNQCENGQWDYGERVPLDHIQPPKEPPEPIETHGAVLSRRPERRTKVVPPPFPIEPRRKKGPPAGDNSNSQYAALGLRACLEAGIVIPRPVLARARDWWLKSQNKDGGWGYNEHGVCDGAGAENLRGVGNASYGSMTVGAAGALCLYRFFLKENWFGDPAVLRGLGWIARHYDVKKNPRKEWAYLYYLYGLERAGMIYGTEKFGPHEWYPDGANHLLDAQKPEGHWAFGEPHGTMGPMSETCFAILFLRRGTVPLVPKKISTGTTKE